MTGNFAAGMMFGTYRELRERYGVGRQVIREAIRIVEFQGLARMGQGRNGGLIVAGQSRDLIARMVGGYLGFAGCRPAEVAQARLLTSAVAVSLAAEHPESAEKLRVWLKNRPLNSVDGNVECTVLAFPVAVAEVTESVVANLFARSLAATMGSRDGWETIWTLNETTAKWSRNLEHAIVTAIEEQDGALAARLMRLYHSTLDQLPSLKTWQRTYVSTDNVIERTRAGHVARSVLGQVLRRTRAKGSPSEDFLLGTVRTLCEEYHVCRATGVQALRILEAAGFIVVKPGRNQGFYLRPPNMERVVEWLSSYLATCTDGRSEVLRFERLFLREAVSLTLESTHPQSNTSIETAHMEDITPLLRQPQLPDRVARENSIVRILATVLRSVQETPAH